MHVRAEHAWATIMAAVLTYEYCAARDQLLSEAVDRWLTKAPWVTRAAIVLTAAHLLNAMPHHLDPWHHATRIRRRRGMD